MKPKIFIDGAEGTTGLQIFDRFRSRTDIELMEIPEEKRKDIVARRELINASDIVFLCLPDLAAAEAVTLIENGATRVIDTSTAHRTSPGWVYGFPELCRGQREKIKGARFLANPGCHATAMISLIYPLVSLGVLPRDYPLNCHSVTGYSGGGKKMIAEYESKDRSPALDSPRQYGITLKHKHMPEVTQICGLAHAPIFFPIAADYYAGIACSVPLYSGLLTGGPTARDIHAALSKYYEGERFITVAPFGGEGVLDRGYIESNAHVGTNTLEIIVYGNEIQTVLVSRLDNLGKGASGAAIQNMNLMLGLNEGTGLEA